MEGQTPCGDPVFFPEFSGIDPIFFGNSQQLGWFFSGIPRNAIKTFPEKPEGGRGVGGYPPPPLDLKEGITPPPIIFPGGGHPPPLLSAKVGVPPQCSSATSLCFVWNIRRSRYARCGRRGGGGRGVPPTPP